MNVAINLIPLLIVSYLILFVVITGVFGTQGSGCFNLKENYEKWYNLNWFGVGFFTVLYYVVFLPITLIAFIFWCFTVGRD